MKLKLLYTLSLLLCLSTIASSNECIRHCRSTAGQLTPGAGQTTPLTTSQDKRATATAEEEDEPAADRLALPLIKLLYI